LRYSLAPRTAIAVRGASLRLPGCHVRARGIT